MFGREVKIDGEASVFVSCSPDTPISEVLFRAASIMEERERKAEKANPDRQKYREAIEWIKRTA